MFAIIDKKGNIIEIYNTWEEAELESELYSHNVRIEELEDDYEAPMPIFISMNR